MNQKLTSNIDPIVKLLYDKMISALTASPESYDLSAVTYEYRIPVSSTAYQAFEILKRPCFRFRGVKKKVVDVAPVLNVIMKQSGLLFDTQAKSSDWKRALRSDFEQWVQGVSDEELLSIYDKMLESDGFDCCSHYMECSDAQHCVHSNIMFAGQCTYRKKLKAGMIFFGKNRNI